MLNTYFSKCWNYSEHPLTDPLERDYVEGDATCPDYLLCTTHKIEQLLNGLDVLKANGPDGISAHMLRATSESIAPSLTNLFKLSITKSHFPKLWKSARVVPIPNLNIVHLGTDQYHSSRYLASSLKNTSII